MSSTPLLDPPGPPDPTQTSVDWLYCLIPSNTNTVGQMVTKSVSWGDVQFPGWSLLLILQQSHVDDLRMKYLLVYLAGR